MKAPVTLAMDLLIAGHVAPFLKKHGFRKKGQRFARGAGDCIQLVEFDRWKYNEGARGKFGLTLAVFCPAVWHMVKQARPAWIGDSFDERFPPVQNCLIDFPVLPPEEDRDGINSLWPLDADQPLEAVANKVLAVLQASALPWLEAHAQPKASLARLTELSRKDGGGLSSMYLLCAAAITHERALAQEALSALLAAKPSKFFPQSERQAFEAIAAALDAPAGRAAGAA